MQKYDSVYRPKKEKNVLETDNANSQIQPIYFIIFETGPTNTYINAKTVFPNQKFPVIIFFSWLWN